MSRHGTTWRYQLGCKCTACVTANRDSKRAWLARVRAEGREPPEHGTYNGYANYRCRCDDCRAAYAAMRAGRSRPVIAGYESRSAPPHPPSPLAGDPR